MATWFFMLILVLLMPLFMIGFGWMFMTNPPKDINTSFGYRTKRSMRNQDTWFFAHKHFGKTWFVCGIVLIPASLVLMFLVMGREADVIRTTGFIILGLQLFLMLGAILPTESALKKKFDEFGRPR
ncbi:MAG: SdpI family protein [Bacteroidales bacterium]|nr:SdpI family protein [Bacteroidales bacterium]